MPETEYLEDLWREAWTPPDRKDVWMWAEEHIENIPYSPIPGRFRVANSPMLAEVMQEMVNPRTRLVSIIAAVQSSKSTAIEVALCYIIANLPGPTLWLDQNDDDARDQAEGRLRKIFDCCQPVKALYPADKYKLRNTTIHFANGMTLWVAGAYNKSNLQRRSIRWLIGDETWRWPQGHMAEAEARTTAFGWLGKCIFCSQGGFAGDDTHAKFDTTDQREWMFTCPHCGKEMTRVKDVIDCWFDSGAMPFAQYHYPFENKELFDSQFPADFISEGIDQTRGWFYSLIVISTFLKGCAPYKNVLVNDLVLDKYGHKMHKSKGNAVEPFSVMNKYGADATRFYMLHASPVWTPLKFDEDGIKEIQSKTFNTLKNTYTFFQMYANADNLDPREFNVSYDNLEEIDKWLLSKYNKLVKNVTDAMEEYDLNKACKELNVFLNEDLSNWYIRRNRRRFWASELDNSKKAVYQTTYQVLVGIVKLMAPIVPFVTDEIYSMIPGISENIMVSKYPIYNKKEIEW